jgi:cytochrome P450
MDTTLPWKSGASNAPLPPMMPGLPLVGNALDLFTDVLGFLIKGYHQMGPIFRIRALNETFTVIAGREANLFMAREGNEHFRSKEFWVDMDKELGARNTLISSDGETHTRLRQLSKRGYSKKVIETHLADVVAITRQAASGWPAGSTRPAYAFLQEVITTQLGTLIAGRAPGDYLKDVIFFVRNALLVKVTRQRPGFLLLNPAYRRAKQRAFELGHQILDWHRQNPPVDRQPNLIDDALEAARDGSLIDDRDLMPLALGPFIAGLDTAASTAAFMLYAVLKHPELMAQIQPELDTLFAGEGPTPEKLKDLDVLHRVTQETLRRYPIAPAVQRTVIKPFEFMGHRVEAGQRIFIGTTVSHFIADYYPDPQRFDIDRYLPERHENRTPGVFAPFSLGAHTCLGAGLAEIQILLTVATLLQYAGVSMAPADYTLKIRTAPTPAPTPGFRIRVAPTGDPVIQ